MSDGNIGKLAYDGYRRQMGRVLSEQQIPEWDKAGSKTRSAFNVGASEVYSQALADFEAGGPRPPHKVEVTFQCDIGDGNEPLEADGVIPANITPDSISVWVNSNFTGQSGHEMYLDVKDIVISPWAPERIVLVLDRDGLCDEDLRRAFRALNENHQP